MKNINFVIDPVDNKPTSGQIEFHDRMVKKHKKQHKKKNRAVVFPDYNEHDTLRKSNAKALSLAKTLKGKVFQYTQNCPRKCIEVRSDLIDNCNRLIDSFSAIRCGGGKTYINQGCIALSDMEANIQLAYDLRIISLKQRTILGDNMVEMCKYLSACAKHAGSQIHPPYMINEA